MIGKWLTMLTWGITSLSAASCPHVFDLWGGSPGIGYVSDWIGTCADRNWETRSERGEIVKVMLSPTDDKEFRAALTDALEALTRGDASPEPCPHQISVRLPPARLNRLIAVCETSARGRAARRLHEMARSLASLFQKGHNSSGVVH